MNSPKTSTRKAKALETRQKIYDTAYSLFQEHGFDNVSVDSIVEAAGVSKGTFYVHFDSKNALISTFFADYVLKVDLDYQSYRESLPPDTKAADILIMLGGKVAEVLSNSVGCDLMKIAYVALLTKSAGSDNILSYNRGLYTLIKKIIEQGIADGEFKKDLNIDEFVRHFILAMRGITYEWCVRHPDFDLKDNFLTHLKFLLEGIKSPL